jgi:hypothetical protein
VHPALLVSCRTAPASGQTTEVAPATDYTDYVIRYQQRTYNGTENKSDAE